MEPLNYLKTLRKKKGVPQQSVADYLGITRQAYSNYENGNREPDNETVLKLAEYFGVSTDVILRGQEMPVPEGGDGTLGEDEELIAQFQAFQETLSVPQKLLLARILETSLRRVQAETASVRSEAN